jgi:arylsulfatase A-like enzyme
MRVRPRVAAAGLGALTLTVAVTAATLVGPAASTAAVQSDPAGTQQVLDHLLQLSRASVDEAAPVRQPRLTGRTRDKLAARASAGKPWNVVVIVTDDQPSGTQFGMPTVRRELMGRGITYSAGVVPTAVCCPSRASLLTGRFASGTGVYDNSGGGVPGGHSAFVANGNQTRTFPYLLRQAGYRTGWFGKYMNEYGADYRGFDPPGWNEFQTFTAKSTYAGFSVTQPYSAQDRNRIRAGKKPRAVASRPVDGYSTTFFGEATADFIRSTPRRKPLLAVYTPYAPHMPSAPQRKYRGTLTDSGWWLTDPSVMEADVSDKPRWVGQTPVSQYIDNAPLGKKLVKQREALLSVDDEVERILDALRQTRRLSRTIVLFTSDNGYMHGQHRQARKGVPYRAATEVPLIMRVGNTLRSGRVDPRSAAANVDLAATVLGVAGLANQTEGYSLLGAPQRTGVPLLGVAHEFEGVTRPPYCGWRTPTQLYVRYGSGEEEFYDYTVDPFELDNAVEDPAFAVQVDALRGATRATCSPAPPEFGPSFDEPTWEYGAYIPPADRDVEE